MKARAIWICALLFGCAPQPAITGVDGRAYVRVAAPEKAPAGIPATEAIYQVANAIGSGKPAYIRSLGAKDSFTRVGNLP